MQEEGRSGQQYRCGLLKAGSALLDICAAANLDEIEVWGPVTKESSHGQERPGFAEFINIS